MTSKIQECTNKQAREGMLEAALLGAPASEAIREHLQACSSCTEEWKQFAATMTLLDEWEAPEPSPYFNTRLHARLREEASAPASAWQRILAPFTHGWRAVAAVSLALVLVVAGILLGTGVLNRPQNEAEIPGAVVQGAAVSDVQSLEHNSSVIQEMNAIDQSVPDNPDNSEE